MSNPQSTAKIAGHPIHPMLVPFPIAFFVGTFASDLMFQHGGDPFWFRATEWLLGAGVVMALLAAVAGIVDLLGDQRIRSLSVVWWHFLGNLLAVVLSLFNWYRRTELGPPAVGSGGLLVSAIVVLILLVTGWLGWEMVYRKRVGIADITTD